MRKNFLLLFLMALLPLAGWAAQDISSYTFTIQTAAIEYSGAAVDVQPTLRNPDVVTPLVLNTDYELVFYKDGEELASAPTDMGDYTVKATGKGGYTGTTNTEISFTITQKSLASAAIGDFVYTACRTTNPTSATYDGVAWEPTATITLAGFTLTADDDYTVSYDANTDAGTAKIIFTATDGGNFTGSVEKEFTIAKATIPDEAITAATPTVATGLTYTGVDQDLLTEGDLDSKYGTIMYQVESEQYSADVPTGKNAATYTLKWKIAGSANYNDKSEASLTDVTIAKCATDLTIMVLPKTKTYDGTAFNAADAQFSIAGRVGDDATAEVTDLTATIASPAAAAADYTVSVTTSNAKIGETLLSNNYNIHTFTNTWTIEKAALTVEIGDVSMTYGASDWTSLTDDDTKPEVTITGTVGEEAVASKFTLAYATETDEVLNGKSANTIEVGTYADAVKVTYNASDDVLKNYDINVTKGSLIVKGSAFSIMPVVASSIEYGDAIAISAYAYNSDNSVASYDATTVSYTVTNADGDEVDITNLPLALGNYTIAIADGVEGTGNNANADVTRLTGTFTIVKKKLTLTVADQTVMKFDDAETFLTGLASADDSYTIAEDLVGDDELVLEFSLATSVTVTDGKIASNAGDYASAIVAALTDAEVNGNYELTTNNAGKLTISDDFTADLDKTTADATIAEAAANGSEYDVTISGRKLTAGKWNTMVLPFEVTTFQFCEAINGYAVFNTLKSASAASNSVKFELQLEKIPANTPFLVKPQAAVDFDEVDASDNKINKFTGVTFEAYTGDQPTATVGDADFIGTYEDVTIEGADGISVMQAGSFVDFGSGNSATLPFTAAYLKLNGGSGAPVITVEEIDGSVTAISGITADGVAIEKDGWYNLNGVQLQGAPAQKGVYIRNGKKIVIK